MPENKQFLPEGLRPPSRCTLQSLKTARDTNEILEAVVQRCDAAYTLHLSLNGIPAQILREDVNAPWINGSERDISVISTVGKQICFTVKSISTDEKGAPSVLLSRRNAQETAMESLLLELLPGSVITGRITHLESFGAFVDIGCGIIGLLPIERISVSRITHSRDRFRLGETILAAILKIDAQQHRITLTQRELFGTWMENASRFSPGETVRGIVRSVFDYGTFVELTPNLSGLADTRPDLHSGDNVSVFIKSLRPERMKVKLHIIESLSPSECPLPAQYWVTDGRLHRWVYSPPGCTKWIETDFTTSSP